MIDELIRFIRESNAIEGICRDPLISEIDAHEALLASRRMSAPALERFVAAVAPGHRRRDRHGLNVYIPGSPKTLPPGGPAIRGNLMEIVSVVPVLGHTWEKRDPVTVHREYENLHPFTDGNGRSGRALWAWHMKRVQRDPFALPFLHRWYYETLEGTR